MAEWTPSIVTDPTMGGAKTAVFTIIANNYLAFARTLMESVAAQHPEFLRFVLFVDETDGFVDPGQEAFTVHHSSVLAIPQNRLFHLKYRVLELATAVKPYYMQFLFERYDIAQLIYMDPDIMLFNRLTPVLDALAHKSIILTPHLTAPVSDTGHPDEREIMQAGAYNLGFIAVRRARETDALLNWWTGRLYNDCIVDVERNLFVDQRWVDLVPGMFTGVEILRDDGLNVAYWNLVHRRILTRRDHYVVNGVPLRFFHFSGFDPENPEVLSRHEDRFLSRDALGDVRAVIETYRAHLVANGYMACKDWPYAYGRFHDGTPIPDLCRRMVRDDLSLQQRLAHLDDAALDDAIIAHANEPMVGATSDIVLTRLAETLYWHRPDLRLTFPLVAGAHRIAYARWFLTDAARDYGLSHAFLRPIAESVEACAGRPFAPWGRAGQAAGASGIWRALQEERRALTRVGRYVTAGGPDDGGDDGATHDRGEYA